MIKSILIANRGEIACRIMRTCRDLGIRTVAVYSDADANARHVRLADEAVHIGAAPAPESYLDIGRIIVAAQTAAVDAVHPGYGFLAENPALARACLEAGLIFIGPAADAIAAMGNKRAAKELVAQAGVPIIPGYSGPQQDDERLEQEAERIGFPLMVKAAAGGGGKGMRAVRDLQELREALPGARREALQAFGDDDLLLEKLLLAPRHIEIQVFGDAFGNVIHLGERECSIQRRHQKVIEEAPSPVMTPALRAQMGAAAVAAAKAINYTNAGTVEFLVEGEDFYFLEMNTRLQVEHPVTEEVTGHDLVAWQIAVAEGSPLPVSQSEVTLDGHAIEVRLYAENPANDFLPVTGPVLHWEPAALGGFRIESGIDTGDDVSLFYDPLLAKLVTYGPDRATALRRMGRALEQTVLLGLISNQVFLKDVLVHPAFAAGKLHTGFIDEHLPDWQPSATERSLALFAVAVAAHIHHPRTESGGYWRNNPNRPLRYRLRPAGQEEIVEVHLLPAPRQQHAFALSLSTLPGVDHHVALVEYEQPRLVLTVDGYRRRVTLVERDGAWWVQTPHNTHTIAALPLLPAPHAPADAAGSLRAPMPGAVIAVLVEEGQRVEEGQPLLKLEAMKMEHTIRTAATGIVEEIYYEAGQTVEADAQLVKIRELD